jgi:hypothetical protein
LNPQAGQVASALEKVNMTQVMDTAANAVEKAQLLQKNASEVRGL